LWRLERMTKLGADGSKQANNGYSVTANCSGCRRVSGDVVLRWVVNGEVGLNGVDQVPGSAAECSGSSGPAARAVEQW
jgi:hypothetical protein